MNTSSLFTNTKASTEEFLAQRLSDRKKAASAIHPSYGALWENIEHVTLAGGKRLRPSLTMIGFGSFSEEILPIAAAQELLHTAMLMHDDIIDQDLIRHGQENISGIYTHKYGKWLSPLPARHYADGSALLGGDLLISEAYHSIAQSGLEPAVITHLLEQLHASFFEVIGGELMDVEAAFVQDTPYDPKTIYRYKTASYSFIRPLLAGATCAGADNTTLESLSAFGASAGIAFQLQDDLLGLFGDASKTGKSTLTDLKEAKATHLIAVHKKNMNAEMSERFLASFGKEEASEADLEELKQDLIASGAKTATEEEVVRYYTEALQALKDLPQKKLLEEFVEGMMGRRV